MTALLVAAGFFLLFAIFGVQMAKFALALENGKPQVFPRPGKKRRLGKRIGLALGLIEELRVVESQKISNTAYELTLSDGTVWQGHNQWWWDKDTCNNPPPGYTTFLRQHQKNLEAAEILRSV